MWTWVSLLRTLWTSFVLTQYCCTFFLLYPELSIFPSLVVVNVHNHLIGYLQLSMTTHQYGCEPEELPKTKLNPFISSPSKSCMTSKCIQWTNWQGLFLGCLLTVASWLDWVQREELYLPVLTVETWVKTTFVDCWLKPHPLVSIVLGRRSP